MTTNNTPETLEQLAKECAGVVLAPHYDWHGCAYAEDFDRCSGHILAALQKVQEESKKDTARLDWIFATRPPHGVIHVAGKGYYATRFDTRESLDAAMEKGTK